MKLIFTAIFLFATAFASSAQQEAAIYQEFKKNKLKSNLPDFSYAGYHYGEKAIPVVTKNLINVTNHGIKANSMKDQTIEVQQLINKIGSEGGGVLYFPKGTYYFNMDPQVKQFLQINYSNIVLRGEGNTVNGTVFMDGTPLTQHDTSPWLSPSLIQTGVNLQHNKSFWGLDYPENAIYKSKVISTHAGVVSEGIQAAKVLTQLSKSAKKGAQTIELQSTTGIKNNDYILLGLYNTDTAGTLIKNILQPIQQFYDFETSAKEAGPSSAPSYQWLVQVAFVNKNSITLKQPLRRDFELKYQPVLAKAPMLTEVGVEDIYFRSAWAGYYCHHGCEGNTKLQGEEMDYGWNAINFTRVANGWIKSVTIENFTNPIYLVDSRNVTVKNVGFLGFDGHSGFKIYSHASDNLIENLNFKNSFTHVLSGEGNAYGNVFRNIDYKASSGAPGLFDFHGTNDRRFSAPAENLFENIKGMNKISGGGAANNLPHTANYNTWWNIELADFKPTDSELFYSWRLPINGLVNNNLSHQMYPKSILVGVYQPQFKVTINGDTADIDDDWIYTENLNKGKIYPVSLYDAQFKRRSAKRK